MRPRVAIAILNWNGKKFLQQFLPSVVATAYENLECVLIDNASTDDSVAWTKQHFPAVRIIANPGNHGFAGGYNEGLKQVEAEYVVLLNQDVEVPSGWLEPVIVMMERDPMIGAAQPKIKQVSDRHSFEYAGAAGGLMDKNYYPFCRGRVFDTVEKDEGQFEEDAEIFWAGGACLVVRKKVFDECGGFDAAYFAHMEEIDLCWRMKNKGYKIMYCAGAEVFHVGGGSLHRSHPFKTFLNFRNSLVTILKNEHRALAWWILWKRLFYDGLAGLNYLRQGRGGDCWAIVRAHVAFYRSLGRVIKQRKALKQAAERPNLTGYIRKNIIWRYYVRRQKTSRRIGS